MSELTTEPLPPLAAELEERLRKLEAIVAERLPAPLPDQPADGPPLPSVEELEERLRKLEAIVAERTEPDLEVIAERVVAKLTALAESRSEPTQRIVIVDGTVPPPIPPAPPPTPPQATVMLRPDPPPRRPAGPKNHRWFLWQVIGELWLILQMYFDPRYRISRTTQIALPTIALALLLNYFFFSVWVSIAVVSPLLERALVVILAVIGYQVLSREIARYRDVLDYLARYGR